MKRYLKYFHPALILLIIAQMTQAQVSNIKSNVQHDSQRTSYYTASSRSVSHSEHQSFGESLAASIVAGIIDCASFVTVEAQKAVIRDPKDYPNTISLEGTIDYGSNGSALTFAPAIKGNWGIFGSEMRYALLHDYTGSLESFDWQVLILRIPIKNIKLNYGLGFTSLLSPKTNYFESSTGFDLYLQKRKLELSGDYRWTNRRDDERYRQELKLSASYRLFSKSKFHLAPMVGFTYQNYFHDDEFKLFNIGLKITLSNN